MHVIPVEKAIETENRSADIEHISHWLKKYEGKYAASPDVYKRQGITYLLYYIAPRRQSGAAEVEKSMEGRCFSPNRAKAGRRENKFSQNPTFAFMHNILSVSYTHLGVYKRQASDCIAFFALHFSS